MLTENKKCRPPLCVVTRSMADAGITKLDTLTSIDNEEIEVSDEQLVAEVFQAMWDVYWQQVYSVQGKNLSPPNALILPPNSLIRQ